MKKVTKNKLEKISGGAVPCGWVGVCAVLTLAYPGGTLISSATGLNSEVGRCWNS